MSAFRNDTRLRFFADPGEFLACAGAHLAAAPVVNTAVTTTAHRSVAQLAAGVPLPAHHWWLAVGDESDAVVGAAMRASNSVPYPLFLLPMPDGAAVALARALHERGEEVLGVNGVLPTAELCVAELARLGGGRVEVRRQTMLYELGELNPPAPVPGRLVPATVDDLALAARWSAAFVGDADEQAGRLTHGSMPEMADPAEVRRRLQAGRLWFWVDGSGAPVHLIGCHPPSFGAARVGPVYTPPEQRGRGWAANAVAEVSRRVQAGGARACLFTDQANPTSNRLYAALGYRPVAELANFVISR
ncbi:GNAT family N-acetyltransferase [Catellatospora sp. KI3]|uniref:GNAT family N-acetyltransferase n=1 Tax=Catellatospora sp. KI3 TaxID=3041620 RepID=UPI0024830906|nr:GNAT family N-acetyltransferase [Catellatospora sp. KI3]MDI1462552.1 GNAT family N-acetyltransferase [Catellatospora sp. KI3]